MNRIISRFLVIAALCASVCVVAEEAEKPLLHQAVEHGDADAVRSCIAANPASVAERLPLFEGTLFQSSWRYAWNEGWQCVAKTPVLRSTVLQLGLVQVGDSAEWVRDLSALDMAVVAQAYDIAEELLHAEADPSAPFVQVLRAIEKDDFEKESLSLQVTMLTPMALAIATGNAEMVQLLLDYGASDSEVIRESIQVLAERGKPLQTTAPTPWKSAMKMAFLMKRDNIVRQLIHHQMGKSIAPKAIPAEIVYTFKNWERVGGNVPGLQQAILSNDPWAFKTMLTYGADPRKTYGYQKNSLDLAAASNNPEFKKILVELGYQ